MVIFKKYLRRRFDANLTGVGCAPYKCLQVKSSKMRFAKTLAAHKFAEINPKTSLFYAAGIYPKLPKRHPHHPRREQHEQHGEHAL